MKTLVILSVLFVYAQASSDHLPSDNEIVSAGVECIQEQKLDRNKVKKMLAQEIIPEDNPEYIDFLICGWKRLGCVTDDGVFNNDNIEGLLTKTILTKNPITDVTAAKKIAKDAVEHCKDAAQGDSVGLKAVKYRNCLHRYVEDTQE